MRLKNDEIRYKLLKRTLMEFLINLKEQELLDYYDWVLGIVQSNNGVRYDTVQTIDTVTSMYEEFVEDTTSVIDKDYNKKRKIIRMIEGTRTQVEKIIVEEWDYFHKKGINLNSKYVKTVMGYLYVVFYYDSKAIENIRKRYQNLAFVLMVLNECQKEELEYIVLYALEHGGTLLNTVFEGRNYSDTNR